MASPTAILSILIRRNPDAEAGLARFNAALDATGRQVPEDLVARGARTFDRSLLAQQDEATKRNHVRAVLRAVSEAGWVSKDDCDMTHEADMAYIRDADAARDEARTQAETLAEVLEACIAVLNAHGTGTPDADDALADFRRVTSPKR